MSKKDTYKTVKERAEAVVIEKKSRFIASVSPAPTEEAAIAFLNEIRSKYPDATHNVYAYVIDENNIFRYSDDGEPSGTAGMPVLDALRKRDIVDTCVVVTRYFGGTLLGTGGLVHTYGASAKAGLEAAKIVIRQLCDIVAINADYTLLGKLQHEIAARSYILEDTVYADEVTFVIDCPTDTTKRVIADITDMTNARAKCTVTGKKYVDIEV